MISSLTHCIKLYAAGSLEAALHEIADAFEKTDASVIVERVFGPSGLLRERIEKGEAASVFATASLKHALLLEDQKRGGPVIRFARNQLCGLLREGLEISSETFLDGLLDPDIRVGTSTPEADPCGDYAWRMFHLADSLRPGAYAALDRKALKLTGGATSEKAPADRNPYAWLMELRKADLFLTYRTNAVLAQKELSGLRIVPAPASLAVAADYCVISLNAAPIAASRFTSFVLSAQAQSILASLP
ncbi:MAG: molybdate ABC transporter substrate-binding protein [Methylococcales bacterium]